MIPAWAYGVPKFSRSIVRGLAPLKGPRALAIIHLGPLEYFVELAYRA